MAARPVRFRETIDRGIAIGRFSQDLLKYDIDKMAAALDPLADQYVSRIFGANRYMVVDRVERLPERVAQVRKALPKGTGQLQNMLNRAIAVEVGGLQVSTADVPPDVIASVHRPS